MVSDEELDTLICKVSKIAEATESLNFSQRLPNNLSALKELKQRRESDLRPATKFLGLTLQEQLENIKREVSEVEEALSDYLQFSAYTANESLEQEYAYGKGVVERWAEARTHLLEELADVQTACETMMAISGASKIERDKVRRLVKEKNDKRGYNEGAGK